LILKVIGIEDVTVVAAGNAKSVDMGQIKRDEFLAAGESHCSNDRHASGGEGVRARPAVLLQP
jgi:hypothetical protein